VVDVAADGVGLVADQAVGVVGGFEVAGDQGFGAGLLSRVIGLQQRGG
jgi:hypothetical protein